MDNNNIAKMNDYQPQIKMIYRISECIFSLAVSVKMNILLMAPAVGAILVLREGWTRTFMHIAICALVQVRGNVM